MVALGGPCVTISPSDFSVLFPSFLALFVIFVFFFFLSFLGFFSTTFSIFGIFWAIFFGSDRTGRPPFFYNLFIFMFFFVLLPVVVIRAPPRFDSEHLQYETRAQYAPTPDRAYISFYMMGSEGHGR